MAGLEAIAVSCNETQPALCDNSSVAVRLRWRLPADLRGDLRSFMVVVSRVSLGSSEEQFGPDPDALPVPARQERPLYEAVVPGLQPNATYKATVQCVGSGGVSAASLQFATRGSAAPGEVLGPRVLNLTELMSQIWEREKGEFIYIDHLVDFSDDDDFSNRTDSDRTDLF